MTKELKHIPNLRFPEFIKLGVWEMKTIDSITSQESSTMTMNRLEFQKEGLWCRWTYWIYQLFPTRGRIYFNGKRWFRGRQT